MQGGDFTPKYMSMLQTVAGRCKLTWAQGVWAKGLFNCSVDVCARESGRVPELGQSECLHSNLNSPLAGAL